MELNLNVQKGISSAENVGSTADCFVGLVADVCEYADDNRIAVFTVSGFGEKHWPVDVWYDLSTIMEDMIKAASCIRNDSYDFSIYFLGQGIQRRLVFSENEGESVDVTCLSETSWEPNPNKISMEKEAVRQMVNNFLSNFFFLARAVVSSRIYAKFFSEYDYLTEPNIRPC